MPPLKAAELHRLAREELGPLLTARGFKRTPRASVASWSRPVGEQWLVMWFQPSQGNGPGAAGFKFTVELRLSKEPTLYAWGFMRRLPSLLTNEELEDLRRMENRVIAKLPPPDKELLSMFPPELQEQWLSGWKPRVEPYVVGSDVWFRHWDETDARDLIAFFHRVLPAAIERFLERATASELT